MNDDDLTAKIDVTMQGKPRLACKKAVIHRDGTGICALSVDLKDKHCVVIATGGGDGDPPDIVIETDQETDQEADQTFIEFPDYKGWSVWSCNIAKYTLSICLIKDKQEKRRKCPTNVQIDDRLWKKELCNRGRAFHLDV